MGDRCLAFLRQNIQKKTIYFFPPPKKKTNGKQFIVYFYSKGKSKRINENDRRTRNTFEIKLNMLIPCSKSSQVKSWVIIFTETK